MSNQYTPDYFLEVFEKTKDSEWCVGEYENIDGQHCALGHCGAFAYDNGRDEIHTPESHALMMLFATANLMGDHITRVCDINDMRSDTFPQDTPKQRIIAALRYIKEKQQA